jgi:hypothetical protein
MRAFFLWTFGTDGAIATIVGLAVLIGMILKRFEETVNAIFRQRRLKIE